MKYIILIIAIISTSCSFVDEPIFVVDEELMPFYNNFINEGLKRGKDLRGVDLVMTLRDMDKDVFGTTNYRLDRVAQIGINKYYWGEIYKNGLSLHKDKDEITVYHELGHALLGRNHKQSCGSIMASEMACKYDLWQYSKKQMWDELFNVK